ncbi:Sugar phosphate isomerase/epimerase [Paucidesulfovibrio gracilis DSM 16080]|uniref:Sugar phosphate isomerase/epimerase n=1 Tax=Paucidesulfovibrio gracilis DSM 16080 TaxID=1121449 RepID=A0A1T4X8T3_9BACT|nr:sugar phosphate isomerase/epimerase [Paucidesulfovibrio gracilis]SKA85518.1 Sugar phosphate isomerase/epimerase [Paucidesulfovibrio gracilis DSM 16080]
MAERKDLKLGLHSYTLHLWGLGQNWGIQADPRPKEMNLFQLMDNAVEWGLDGLHITGCDLESKDDARLAEVRKEAEKRGLYLEYNFSLDEEFDSRLTDTIAEGVRIASGLGSDLAKISLDIRRPRPLYGSCFHPQVMRQLCNVYDEVMEVLPKLEETGVRLALENHTETFADEVLWLINRVNHPLVGACVDTVNSMGVLENPEYATEVLAPYAFSNHFCDHKLDRDQFGIRFHGVALGDGDIDCFKTLNTIIENSPTDRITFEIEWDMENDSLEEARKKQLDACIRSIKYAREVLKIGR